MFGDRSGAKSAKLICDISEAVEHELDIFIVISLEVFEEITKYINVTALASHCLSLHIHPCFMFEFQMNLKWGLFKP